MADKPRKKGTKPFLKVLGKVAEFVIPMLLPLLSGGKRSGNKSPLKKKRGN